MNFCDALLDRLPLAGVSGHTYDTEWGGKLCKVANVTTRLALIVLAALMFAQVVPLTPACFAIAALAATHFVLFVLGSSDKRRAREALFEFVIISVCITLVILAGLGTLTSIQAGKGVLGTILGGIALGVPADRGRMHAVPHAVFTDITLLEEDLESMLPPWPLLVLDYVVGVSRDIAVEVTSIFTSLTNHHNYGDLIPENDADALCVFTHGLASRPAVFDEYHETLSSHRKNITIFQPHVTENGKCTLEKAKASMQQEIEKWCNSHKEDGVVIFVGHSNGARIVGAISSELKLKGIQNPMQVHCIAGPFHGTEFVNRPSWYEGIRGIWGTLLSAIYSSEISTELASKSEHGVSVITNMQKAAQQYANLNYKFYASPADALIYPFTSSCPNVPRAHYFLVSGDGHQGMLYSVKEAIIEDTLNFAFYKN